MSLLNFCENSRKCLVVAVRKVRLLHESNERVASVKILVDDVRETVLKPERVILV